MYVYMQLSYSPLQSPPVVCFVPGACVAQHASLLTEVLPSSTHAQVAPLRHAVVTLGPRIAVRRPSSQRIPFPAPPQLLIATTMPSRRLSALTWQESCTMAVLVPCLSLTTVLGLKVTET